MDGHEVGSCLFVGFAWNKKSIEQYDPRSPTSENFDLCWAREKPGSVPAPGKVQGSIPGSSGVCAGREWAKVARSMELGGVEESSR